MFCLLQRVNANLYATSKHTTDTKTDISLDNSFIRLSNIVERAKHSPAVQHISMAAQQRCILASPENYFGLFLRDAE
jgi:hypothetical protein